ncbi:hypothetical protein LSH36_315g03165 [Paralvinella palmiformis]|uniref:ethanolamine kinase n=1 Tax=Paralvinella palmiformis TaxID=53620 RepID=A0AAD9JHQ8_9ANNE|nr:hypothetical protein LSH36_315g03165 [Paralvinella palmiformis]
MVSINGRNFTIPGVMFLDLSLTENQLQEGARAILKRIRPKWKYDAIKFKIFTVGITNKLIGCYQQHDCDMNDCILIRIYGKKTEMFVDRELELLAIYVLNMAKCSASLYAKFNNGIAYGFLPGRCVNAETTRDPEIGRLIAEEMVKFSFIDPSKYGKGLSEDSLVVLDRLNNRKPVTFKYINRFLDIFPESFPDPKRNERFHIIIPSVYELKEEVQQLALKLNDLGSPTVFSHNDLLLNNIVYDEKKECCYFIDYEYAGFNYQAFDIGNHFCEWAGVEELDYDRYPDKPTQLRWLRHYLKAYKKRRGDPNVMPTDDELEALYVQVNQFSLASHLMWGVWAIVQARYSTIDFDFLEYSKLRLDQYYKTKEEFLSLTMPE